MKVNTLSSSYHERGFFLPINEEAPSIDAQERTHLVILLEAYCSYNYRLS